RRGSQDLEVARPQVHPGADVRPAELGALAGGVAGLVGLVPHLDPDGVDAVLELVALVLVEVVGVLDLEAVLVLGEAGGEIAGALVGDHRRHHRLVGSQGEVCAGGGRSGVTCAATIRRGRVRAATAAAAAAVSAGVGVRGERPAGSGRSAAGALAAGPA